MKGFSMKRIKELLVVEGKHDADKLHSLFDCDVVLTNGLALDEQTLDFIEAASQTRDIIIFTDSDYPGETIRRKVAERVPQAKHCFIAKEFSTGKRNVGVEYGNNEAIVEALNNVVTFEKDNQSISWQQYLQLELAQHKDKRDYLCHKIHVGICNNKTLFKRLNMMTLDYNTVKEILDESKRSTD